MQETEEMHQPEPVPEVFVPDNEAMQTSPIAAEHVVNPEQEQAQDDAVMAEADVSPFVVLVD